MITMDTSWRLDLERHTLSNGGVIFEFAPYSGANGLPVWWRKMHAQGSEFVSESGLRRELETAFVHKMKESRKKT